MSDKECFRVVKYIKPKTFTYINGKDNKSHLGFVADDFIDVKMPREWDNIIYKTDKDLKLMACNKTAVLLWGAVREMQKEIITLKSEVTNLKNKSN